MNEYMSALIITGVLVGIAVLISSAMIFASRGISKLFRSTTGVAVNGELVVSLCFLVFALLAIPLFVIAKHLVSSISIPSDPQLAPAGYVILLSNIVLIGANYRRAYVVNKGSPVPLVGSLMVAAACFALPASMANGVSLFLLFLIDTGGLPALAVAFVKELLDLSLIHI